MDAGIRISGTGGVDSFSVEIKSGMLKKVQTEKVKGQMFLFDKDIYES